MLLKDLMPSKYIIFDFDGVIVDSEKEYFKAWKKASCFYGYSLSDNELLSLRSCDKSIASQLFGDTSKYDIVRAKRRELMNESLKLAKFSLKTGIKEAFSYLKENGYTIIIATSSALDMVNMHLSYYDLDKYIYEVLSVKSLKRGKPYPDIYIEICKHYGLNPKEVLAVEDSPNGLKSAHTAGLNTLMIPDLTDIDEDIKPFVTVRLNSAFDIINNLEEKL